MRAFVVDEPTVATLRALNYSPTIERIRRAGSNSAIPLREIVKDFGLGYEMMFSRRRCEPEHGVELLSQGDMFASEPVGNFVRRDSMAKPESHLVKERQILIAGAGTLGATELFGRSIVADRRLAGKYVGEHCMTLELEEPESDLSLFAYAWLASPTGVQAIRSSAYGTKILGLRRDLLSTTPVPLAAPSVVSKIAGLIRVCAKSREDYLSHMMAARAVFNDMAEVRQAHDMCAARQRRSVLWSGPFGTLSAWTFASTAGALSYLRKTLSERLSDFVEPGGVFRGGRGQRIPCVAPFGVNFLSQRDAFLIRPVPQRVLLPSSGLLPRTGTIMVGGQGTLGEGEIFGRAAIVSEDGARSAWTEHLLRIVPRVGEEARLFAFLTTTVGFRLLRSTAVGTKLLSMRPDLLLDLPIPVPSVSDGNRIDQHVREGLAARASADTSEAEAIRIIEQEVVPQWLA